MPDPVVDILLSTHNGGRFLAAQLASLQSQTRSDWRLLVRDDGSTDNTRVILADFASRDPRITPVVEPAGNLQPARSFLALATRSTAPYFMFCDQDDIWLPHKIEASLESIERIGNPPALVFSDLQVIAEDGRLIHPSSMAYSGMDPSRGCTFDRLLMQNVAPGCTMIGNRALWRACRLDAGWPGPVYLHDWWLMLLASVRGRITYMPEATMQWRQHGRNTSGGSPGLSPRRLSASRRNPWRQVQMHIHRIAEQATTLLAFCGPELDETQRDAATWASGLGHGFTPWKVAKGLFHGRRCHAWTRNAAMLAFSWPSANAAGKAGLP